MQDEQFMRQWNEVHEGFTADLHHAISPSSRHAIRQGPHPVIGSPYGRPGRERPQQVLSPTAQASLRGFAASVITVALWMTVVAVATPASGLA